MIKFVIIVVVALVRCKESSASCGAGEWESFSRVGAARAAGRAAPVFVYVASGDERSLTGSCLERCRALPSCKAVELQHAAAACHGLDRHHDDDLTTDHDVTYYVKICVPLPEGCSSRWWSSETVPGYRLQAAPARTIDATLRDCRRIMMMPPPGIVYRSAQWLSEEVPGAILSAGGGGPGRCALLAEDRVTQPELYRVADYSHVYLENQCTHDYSKRIDRCSYEEYQNQTLRHVDYTFPNVTKEQCRKACEDLVEFVCRGFSWRGSSGTCDLHSEDLVAGGSWLLRPASDTIYSRRVVCLNITVECSPRSLTVVYRPRGAFSGRLAVAGRGERCGARAQGNEVRLVLPLSDDCDVQFARAIYKGPDGPVNRTMAYVTIMVQHNPIIQTAGDRWLRVGCEPLRPVHHVNATVAVSDDTYRPSPPGVMWWGGGGAPLRLAVLRPGQQDNSPAALGELLELRLETDDPRPLSPYHLVASSRLGDSSVLLLDGRGCPTHQVEFPAFTRSWFAGVQRLTARFRAFRFPGSRVVRFTLMARYCDGPCDEPVCDPPGRQSRGANGTEGAGAAGGWALAAGGCGALGVDLEVAAGAADNTAVRADHRTNEADSIIGAGVVAGQGSVPGLVCAHESVAVALALCWLAVQLLLLLGCCVVVKRYRNLAESALQKDYQSFDNGGFESSSGHRRVHWPDEPVTVLHS